MFAPLFRILSAFLVGIGLLGGTTGVYALVFRGELVRFVILMAVAVVLALAGYKIREHAGELDLVTMRPEDLANNFEIPKALGLGANAAAATSALVGGLVGAAIIGAVRAHRLHHAEGLARCDAPLRQLWSRLSNDQTQGDSPRGVDQGVGRVLRGSPESEPRSRCQRSPSLG